ncbi:MAG: protein-L-isoaspartate(D-aspartate) O-methyltransferase [Puniceicoccaceae bacterium]|nr:MAG: protein-L-isoaspartate(D-aspartate) O-methyltransferase [Puniceicoccaceae bacterium]
MKLFNSVPGSVLAALLFVPGATAVAETSDRIERAHMRMVEEQIVRRGVHDPVVVEAVRAVPRHLFTPGHSPLQAYADSPLPIGHGQTISQPYIVAYMTEQVRPKKGDRALEIGAGSGYQAAILAEIVDKVYTLEIIPELATGASERLRNAGYPEVEVRQGDGYYGWEEHAPFDIIVVTAAAEHIPPPLIEQLKDGGRMIIPVGHPFRTQRLVLVEKENGEVSTRNLLPVRFVPFTRAQD